MTTESASLSEEDYYRKFCLGLPGWCPCVDCSSPLLLSKALTTTAAVEKPREKPKMSLSLKRKNGAQSKTTKSDNLED